MYYEEDGKRVYTLKVSTFLFAYHTLKIKCIIARTPPPGCATMLLPR